MPSYFSDKIANYGGIATVLGLVTVVYYFRRWYRLRDFKGPWLASFSELWLGWTALSGTFHTTLIDVNKRYGTFDLGNDAVERRSNAANDQSLTVRCFRFTRTNTT